MAGLLRRGCWTWRTDYVQLRRRKWFRLGLAVVALALFGLVKGCSVADALMLGRQPVPYELRGV